MITRCRHRLTTNWIVAIAAIAFLGCSHPPAPSNSTGTSGPILVYGYFWYGTSYMNGARGFCLKNTSNRSLLIDTTGDGPVFELVAPDGGVTRVNEHPWSAKRQQSLAPGEVVRLQFPENASPKAIRIVVRDAIAGVPQVLIAPVPSSPDQGEENPC